MDDVADDALDMAECIVRWIRAEGAEPELKTVTKLAAQIVVFVQLRHRARFLDISNPTHHRIVPEEWTAHEEAVWRDWIQRRFTLEDWRTAVLYPVFGTGARQWEDRIPGWRDELFLLLPWWIRRSRWIVEENDPTPLEEPVEEDLFRTSKIDPYLLEHGGGGRRRR